MPTNATTSIAEEMDRNKSVEDDILRASFHIKGAFQATRVLQNCDCVGREEMKKKGNRGYNEMERLKSLPSMIKGQR